MDTQTHDEAYTATLYALDEANPKFEGKSYSNERAIRYLESECSALTLKAQERGDWDYICKQKSPTLAAEKLAIFLALKDMGVEADNIADQVVSTLKRVKRHLIYRDKTVLKAFETSSLIEAIQFCNKQDSVKPITMHNSEQRLNDVVEDETSQEVQSEAC